MLTETERLACATEFEVCPEWWLSTDKAGRSGGPVTISRRVQMDGATKWAVYLRGNVLTKGGRWTFEHMPSSRTDAHLRRTRFDTLDEAWAAAVKATRKMYRQLKRLVPDGILTNDHRHPIELPKWVTE